MDINLNSISILVVVWTLKSIISNFWLFKVGGDFINHGFEITPMNVTLNERLKYLIYLPGVIGLLPIYLADLSIIAKIILAIFMLDPHSYKILKLPSSFIYPDLRTGYKYYQHLKNNPIDAFYLISVSGGSRFGVAGAALLVQNRNMLKERILENDNKKQKLLDLLSNDTFVSYFYNNHREFYNLYKVYLGSKNKDFKLDPMGIEIASHVMTRDENDEYFIYVRDQLMKE